MNILQFGYNFAICDNFIIFCTLSVGNNCTVRYKSLTLTFQWPWLSGDLESVLSQQLHNMQPPYSKSMGVSVVFQSYADWLVEMSVKVCQY